MNLGFIGLGSMGSGMAANLLQYCRHQGHRLLVHDLNQAVLDDFAAKGAETPGSVRELAQQVQVLFTSLPGAAEIGQLARGEDGILQRLPPGAIWFETSTNELTAWEELRREAPDGLTLVDAPVTGGAEGAAAGTLTMLLGIDDAELRQYAPILAAFTRKAMRMGPAGAGYVGKLCQLHLNYLLAQGIGETLMLAARAELDMSALHEMLQHSCAQSYVAEHYIPKVLDGSYDPSFSLGLASRDMRLVTELGRHLQVDLTLADRVYDEYRKAAAQFGEGAPHLSVIKLIEERSGRLLRA